MEARCRGSHVIDAVASEFGDAGHKQVVVVFQAEVADDLSVVSRQFLGLFEDLVRTLPTKGEFQITVTTRSKIRTLEVMCATKGRSNTEAARA